jgi:XTP/dITP diphosphohydrolase
LGSILKRKVVFFATGNIHKFYEAKAVLSKYGLAIGMLRAKGIEIQSDSLSEIASASALNARKTWHLPIIVEDAGLFVDSLKGFPGPYSAYVYKTIENRGLLKIMDGEKNRRAVFRSALAYCDNESDKIEVFEGETAGEITRDERIREAKSAFGFDPIFRPEGSNKTFAEMKIEEKNCFSHRSAALNKFAKWYKEESLL